MSIPTLIHGRKPWLDHWGLYILGIPGIGQIDLHTLDQGPVLYLGNDHALLMALNVSDVWIRMTSHLRFPGAKKNRCFINTCCSLWLCHLFQELQDPKGQTTQRWGAATLLVELKLQVVLAINSTQNDTNWHSPLTSHHMLFGTICTSQIWFPFSLHLLEKNCNLHLHVIYTIPFLNIRLFLPGIRPLWVMVSQMKIIHRRDRRTDRLDCYIDG